MNIGVDAHIALEFHEAREAHPEKFNSRLRNKMFYGQVSEPESDAQTNFNFFDITLQNNSLIFLFLHFLLFFFVLVFLLWSQKCMK